MIGFACLALARFSMWLSSFVPICLAWSSLFIVIESVSVKPCWRLMVAKPTSWLYGGHYRSRGRTCNGHLSHV